MGELWGEELGLPKGDVDRILIVGYQMAVRYGAPPSEVEALAQEATRAELRWLARRKVGQD